MGQYFKIVNLDKREFIHPHDFGDGAKLMEFGRGAHGTMAGLALLLADNIPSECRSRSPVIGRWAGDRIIITGDGVNTRTGVPADFRGNLNAYATEHFKDVSAKVREALAEDWPEKAREPL